MAQRKVAQIKECTLLYVAPGGATFKFYTDLPGGVFVERTGGVALPPTNANHQPGTFTVVFSNVATGVNYIEGSAYYPEIDPPSNNFVEILEGVVWLRSVGVYLDGTTTPPDKWDTLPIAVGA
jgi:hypothetical protein